MAELDSLEIRIQSESETAASGIDKLTASLTRLRSSAKGGAGLTSTVNQLTKLSAALSSIGNVKSLSNLAEALKPLQSVEKSAGFVSSVTALQKLPKIINSLSSSELQKFGLQIKLVAKYMAPLATEMEKVANGFASLPSRIQRIIRGNSSLANSNKRAASSFKLFAGPLGEVIAKFAAYQYILYRVVNFLADCVTSINDYVENVNLFQVAMGDYFDEAFAYAQLVNDKLGIDPSEWMRNQGVFMSMAKGFGVTQEQAYALSEGLTELSYDLSSLYNEDMESSALRLQSALAGEIEPIRRLGISISQATLQEYALSLGIDESVASMTEQEKALLRSMKLMEGAANIGAIGDFARTLESPANALRVLNQQIMQFKRAIGSVMLPVIVQILPYIQAFVELLTEAISALATLVGFTMPEWDASDWGSGITSGAVDATDAVGDTTAAIKELKNATLGIDELNILAPSGGGSGGSGSGGSGTSGWASGLEIPDVWDKAELSAMQRQVDELKEKLKPVLELAVEIGAAFLTWKLAKGFLSGLDALRVFLAGLGTGSNLGNLGMLMGLGANFFDDIRKFVGAVEDIIENGADFYNVTDFIAGFSGALGSALAMLGKTQLGGALLVVSGVTNLVRNLADIAENGANAKNILGVIDSLGQIALALGLLTKNTSWIGAGLIIRGITTVVEELSNNWEAIKQGDWSGVDKGTLLIGALQIAGGVVAAISTFKKTVDAAGGAKTIIDAGTTTGTLSDAIGDSKSGGLTTKLGSLAKNLGLGLVVVLEVSAAALIIVGTIALLGEELKAVGDAWAPVIENGSVTAAAVALGATAIAVVGLAAYGLGTLGGPAALNIGIGTGILLELGIATGLFLAEVWIVGKALDEIGKAWQPVLNNGEPIAEGIAIGTALLVGIGVVTAALGVATVASVGLLPAAIGLGTAILVELAAAFILFTESLVDVADELSGNLAPSLRELDEVLPQLSSDMSDFTEYMSEFAGEVADYTDSMGGVTWSGIVSGFQRLFVGSPIQDLADDVAAVYRDTKSLNSELRQANPELEYAVLLLTSYTDLLAEVQVLTEKGEAVNLSSSIFVNLKDAGAALVAGFAEGMRQHIPEVKTQLSYMGAAIGVELNSAETRFEQFRNRMLTAVKSFSTSFASAWSSVWKNAGSAFVSQWNRIVQSIETGLNNTLAGIQKANKSLSNKTYSRITIPRVAAFASGGFPESGQLFLANEAGPEMVGRIGRQTAVANNDQIVEGIAVGVGTANEGLISAVYAAAQQIIRAVEAGGDVYMDGYKVGERVTRSQNRQNRVYGRTLQNV